MKIKGLIAVIAVALTAVGLAETWHLTDGAALQLLEKTAQNKAVSAVADAKQLVSQGKTAAAKEAFEKLKTDYPQLAGSDYDAFVEAELLYSKRKYDKAQRAYEAFTDKFPHSPLFDSALDRQHQIATAFLSGQKRVVLGVLRLAAYEEGQTIMEKIADKAGDSPRAQRALITAAKSHQKRGDYYQAYKSWAAIWDKWPAGEVGKESLLEMGKSLEADYKGPKFDAKVLQSAKSYYSQYQEKYPESPDSIPLTEKIALLDEKLAEKELTVADYYKRTANYQSAKLYYQSITADWPQSAFADDAQKKLNETEAAIEKLAKEAGKKRFDWRRLIL